MIKYSNSFLQKTAKEKRAIHHSGNWDLNYSIGHKTNILLKLRIYFLSLKNVF